MNDYETRRAERIERMKSRAAKLTAEAEATRATAAARADRIPCGQPILVGHHSEKRHRKDLARIDNGFRKSFELADEAKSLARRAERAEASTAISSDDPDAVAKLREQLADLERSIEGTKAANKLLRASAHPPTGDVIRQVADLVGWTELRTASWLGILHSMGRKTFSTTNGGAERRRLLARIGELEARALAPAKEPETVGKVRIEESDNRVRVIFPGKPEEAIRQRLKSAGFRWSPTAGAWQRQPGTSVWELAREIARAFRCGASSEAL
jgi:Domain of unknown function (DUF3560)